MFSIMFYDIFRGNCTVKETLWDPSPEEFEQKLRELRRLYGWSSVVVDDDGNIIILRTRM